MKVGFLKTVGLLLKKACYYIIQDKVSKPKFKTNEVPQMQEAVREYSNAESSISEKISENVFKLNVKQASPNASLDASLDVSSVSYVERFARECLNLDETGVRKFIWSGFLNTWNDVDTRWQTVRTSDIVVDKLINKYKFNENDKILVIFNIEIIKGLICTFENLRYENLYFITDSEENFKWITDKFKLINVSKLEYHNLECLTKKIGEFNVKKFDIVFSNPPYDKNLHLKIVDEASKFSKNIVWISPVRWLEDPFAKNNKRSDWNIFSNIRERIKDIEIIDFLTAQDLFKGTKFSQDLAIYKLDETIREDNTFEKPIMKKYFNKVKVFPQFDWYKKDGWRIRLPRITNSGGDIFKTGRPVIGKLIGFYNGEKDGKKWWEFYQRNQYSKTTDEITLSIKMNSQQECINFAKSFNTNFGKYITHLMFCDKNMDNNKVMWLENAINPRTKLKGYLGEWTDDDLNKYFELDENLIKEINDFMNLVNKTKHKNLKDYEY